MKTQVLEIKGKITKVLSNAMYNVRIEKTESDMVCYLCGKMNKKFIKPEIGDTVLVEMSPTDLKKGRIIRRF